MIKGRYKLIHRRKGKVLGTYYLDNKATFVGANAMLDAFFIGGAAGTGWYLGLVDNASFSFFSATDTMLSHGGWIEFTDYSGARKEWITVASTNGAMDNSLSLALFIFNTLAVVRGIFLVNDSTKGGTTGLLYSTALFGSDGLAGSLTVGLRDEIEIRYDISLTTS